jgi:hypothetical protein
MLRRVPLALPISFEAGGRGARPTIRSRLTTSFPPRVVADAIRSLHLPSLQLEPQPSWKGLGEGKRRIFASPLSPASLGVPRQESNLRTRFRKPRPDFPLLQQIHVVRPAARHKLRDRVDDAVALLDIALGLRGAALSASELGCRTWNRVVAVADRRVRNGR